MKKFIRFSTTMAAIVIAVQAALAAAPTNYYNGAIGKSDEALMTALRNIIRDHKTVSYGGLLDAYKTTDTDAQGYIIDMYSNVRYKPSDNGSSASHVGEGYNREHSFPKSWFDDATPMYSDLFHVYPTDIKVNSQRNNYPYGVCANGTRLTYGSYYGKGKLGTSTYNGYSGTVFEPDDEYKGDFARTYFYMVTCYKNELPSWSGSPNLNYSANKYKAFSTWTINMLMEWTRLDPVSEKETKRNDAVYSYQNNRNPFIDHPELAEYIWGNKQGQKWSGTSEPVPGITSPTYGTTFETATTVGTASEFTITVKGDNLSQDLSLTMSDNDHFTASKSTFTANEVNNGTTLVMTFNSNNQGSFENVVTLSSDEVSTTFTIIATATDDDPGTNPPVAHGDSIIEDWEGCTTGGYWDGEVEGNAWTWQFDNAGIWGDNLSIDEQSCRLGKDSNSSITMLEDFEGGASAISLMVGSFGSDKAATLNIDYSTNKGSTWTTLGSVTTSSGALQRYELEIKVESAVRFRIVETAGSRVNIDNITIYGIKDVVVIGDVNGDGEVNISDVNAVIDIILGGTADDDTRARADVNGDGEINISDINAIIDIILGS